MEEPTMIQQRTIRTVAVLPIIAALLVAACGGSTNSPSASAAAAPSATAATASDATTSAAPSASVSTAYTGPAATIEYSIWGDPTELKNQQAIVDAFHAV